jgi:hypothetical protein
VQPKPFVASFMIASGLFRLLSPNQPEQPANFLRANL